MTIIKPLPVALTVITLVACFAESATRPKPANAATYHARVRNAVEASPRSFGPWVGEDKDVPPSAMKLLRPNALVSRNFVDAAHGRSAALLVVACQDANDLLGHYPPNCYPSQGYSMEQREVKTAVIGDQTITYVEYEFGKRHRRNLAEVGSSPRPYVFGLLILPNGTYAEDMDQIHRAAASYRKKFFGAAQVQVVTDSSVAPAEREGIFREIIQANLPLLQALRSGGNQ